MRYKASTSGHGNARQAPHRFCEICGHAAVAGLGRPGYRHYFLEISATDLIAFFEWPDAAPVALKDHGVPVAGPVAFDHVSIGVGERDDLWELKDRLEAAGFWASEIIDHGFILSLYAFDPNNIAIEFSWSVPGVDIRAHPAMADRHASAVAREGADPQPGNWPRPDRPTPPDDRRVYPGEGRELLTADATDD